MLKDTLSPAVFENILAQAKSELARNPFDAGHDELHHQEVFENCLKIVKGEELEIDRHALTLAAWMHDYERNDESARDSFVRKIINKNGFPDEFADKVIAIMSSHSFGEDQDSIEQKILFDADKLEYINPTRIKRVLNAVEEGQMTEAVWSRYKNAWEERLPKVRGLLHFDTSRRVYDELSEQFNVFRNIDERMSDLRDIMI